MFIKNKISFYNNSYRTGNLSGSLLRFKQADTMRNVDLLIIGSSHAVNGYDPRIFKKANINAFVLGTISLNAGITQIILDKYLDQINPKFIILDVFDLCTLGKLSTETSTDYISNDDLSILELTKIFLHSPSVKVFNSSIYSFWDRQKKEIFSEYFNDMSKRYINGGYLPINSIYKDSVFIKKEVNSVSLLQKKYFENIIRKIEDKGIGYVIIQSPVIEKVYKQIDNKDNINFYFSSFGNYYNFNLDRYRYLFELSDFGDAKHLNVKGVQKFNDFIIDKILYNN